jgi:pyruvate kinase
MAEPQVWDEPIGKIRTKIVATLGPASDSPDMVRRLVNAGVDCFRINASHGNRTQRTQMLRTVREVAEQLERTIAVLLDLGGPKIRLGPIPGDSVDCILGATFKLVNERSTDDPHELTCTYRTLCDDLADGDSVLFADGTVAMQVAAVQAGCALLVVTLAGRLRSGQGVNLPGSELKVAALTDADLADLDWLEENPVEYVGLSFARTAADVVLLRTELRARACTSNIITKIEKPQAVANFDSILEVTDGVMVARGDLGVEMDVARVPAIQKRIIAACHRARVPVITATQMLQSMEISNRPTRAEASDVFNAVLDGTDAVMLSGETAIGQYPVDAVAMMSRIVAEAERSLAHHWDDPGPSTRQGWITPVTEAMVDAASVACRRLNAALLVVATHSGRTALALSKQRHDTPTLALARTPELARAMALYWGVTPTYVADLTSLEDVLHHLEDWAKRNALIRSGDNVVLLRGTIPGNPVQNALAVHHVR